MVSLSLSWVFLYRLVPGIFCSIFLSLCSYNPLLIILYDRSSYIVIMNMIRSTIYFSFKIFSSLFFPLNFFTHFSIICQIVGTHTHIHTHIAVGSLIDIAKILQINLKRIDIFYIWISKSWTMYILHLFIFSLISLSNILLFSVYISGTTF